MYENKLLKAEEVTQLLKSISHPRRLLLLCLLVDSERTVNDLKDKLGTSLGNISQQLNLLEEYGLIQKRRDGNKIYCSIADERLISLIKTLYKLYCS